MASLIDDVADMFITKGFSSRKRKEDTSDRLPPGQYVTSGFPILQKGLTPVIDPDVWSIKVFGMVASKRFTLEDLQNLPSTSWVKDIHCVTKWSKFDSAWKGVLFDEFLTQLELDGQPQYVMAHSADDYTTNIPLDDLIDGKALIAYEYDNEPISDSHGGPVRLVVPHLYFWKSAKWLNGLEFIPDDKPGFWEERGYHNYGDPWLEQRYEGD